nr:heme-degrading domain-containing protein [Rhizobium sp. Q54]
MTIEKDLDRILEQERALCFPRFDAATGWELGSLLREMALERQAGVVIDVHLHSMPLFYCALPGTTADNAAWVRRKRAVTLRFFRSSYALGLALSAQGTTVEAKYGVSPADFATHGGSFPIVVEGTGCVGAVTVSGLPQREDHNMVVEALCRLLGKDNAALCLDRT